MASRLIGSYPHARAHDPETFTTQLVRLFLRFDRAVIEHVVATLPTEPIKAWDGLPSLADIRQACEEQAFRIAREAERELNRDRQMREMDEDQCLYAQQIASGARDRIVAGFDALRAGLKRQSESAADAKRRRMAAIERGNERMRDGGTVTPMLRKLIGAA